MRVGEGGAVRVGEGKRVGREERGMGEGRERKGRGRMIEDGGLGEGKGVGR